MPNEPLPDDIRNVWQNQPVENIPMPLEEIRRKARQFEKRIRRRNLREYLGAALGIAAYTYYFFKFDGLAVRAGSLLVIAGVIYVVVQLYQRAAPAELPADLAFTASREFHRQELVRQRDLLRSVWSWYIAPVIPGLVVFMAGILPHRAGVTVGYLLVFFGFFGFVVWLNRRGAARLDRQIAEIDDWESQP
jgi:Flp pilus assembly protein TadB